MGVRDFTLAPNEININLKDIWIVGVFYGILGNLVKFILFKNLKKILCDIDIIPLS